MFLSQRVRRGLAASATLAATVASVLAPSVAHADPATSSGLAGINHIVVIYEENHSFDNLFGLWEGVHGLPNGKDHTTQNGADGKALPCLLQNDVNLTSPDPLAVTCHGTSNNVPVDSAFDNKPFLIDQYIKPDDPTCPKPGVFAQNGVKKTDPPTGLSGGCTRDLVHRFYQEQYQIDGGKQDRYVLGSDAMGLTMGYYDTKGLPIYEYLHASGAPHYTVDDNFFQGAFGGSFLNHQFLIAAAAPKFENAAHGGDTDLHSIVGPDGEPKYYLPLQTPVTGVVDGALTQAANSDGSCAVPAGKPTPPAGTVCGDFAVNTIQPTYQPFAPGTAAAKQLPPQTGANIGDSLSAKNVDWAWYSGGWSNANGDVNGPGWTNGSTPGTCTNAQTITGAVYPNCADALFQFHHQPFNYYKNYAPGTDARKAHLRDEAEFIDAAKGGKLRPVSFVKPVGEENEHPGYASEDTGSSHLVELLKAIEGGPQAADTMVVVTYDEFGGQWDHVSPPKGDKWGPGTRIPALVISPKLEKSFAVDHTVHDTTSILATIEHRFGLEPLGADTRDGKVADLSAGLTTGGTGGGSGLPITGTSIAPLILVGLGLLIAGGAATVLARRRRVG